MLDMRGDGEAPRQEHCASVIRMIRHYVVRKAKMTDGYPHNADADVLTHASRLICKSKRFGARLYEASFVPSLLIPPSAGAVAAKLEKSRAAAKQLRVLRDRVAARTKEQLHLLTQVT
jgi:hypothetical protein